MHFWPLFLYYALFLTLTVHGFHRALLCWRLRRGRTRPAAEPNDLAGRRPAVTVQLPLFNERYVAERLIQAVAELDWPREALEIQVLDDSTDDTAEIVAAKVRALRAEGVCITHVRRPERTGYKAGALALGLTGGDGVAPARGSYIAIFDADFLPRRDFLQRTVPLFERDPRLALVQARWEHVNREHSLLTRLQAIFLDAHFAVEHEARRRVGLFLNFNGTAGVWRKRAILDAGGWSHDTLTEDLDLSFRAQLRGMRFTYVHDVGVPSELPIDMGAFKGQQHRWAKGSIETARKLLPELVWRRDLPLGRRLEGAFHLVNNFAYAILFLAALLALPVARLKTGDETAWTRLFDGYLIGFGVLPVIGYFLLGQVRVGRSVWRSLFLMPAALALGIGISFNNARAVFEALWGRRSGFVRTPKYHLRTNAESWLGRRYRATRGIWPGVELAMGIWCGSAVWLSFANGNESFGVLMTLFATGFLWVGFASLLPSLSERLRQRWATFHSADTLATAGSSSP